MRSLATTEQYGSISLRDKKSGLCVRGVYAYHSGYLDSVRRAYWETHFTELRTLASDVKYRDCRVAIEGDFNEHLAQVTENNLKKERAYDRRVAANLKMACGFCMKIPNPVGQPTHKSGTAIDMSWVSRAGNVSA